MQAMKRARERADRLLLATRLATRLAMAQLQALDDATTFLLII